MTKNATSKNKGYFILLNLDLFYMVGHTLNVDYHY